MRDSERSGAVVVSVVVQDARGFTHHYEDFTTSPESTRRALTALATGSSQSKPESEVPDQWFLQALYG